MIIIGEEPKSRMIGGVMIEMIVEREINIIGVMIRKGFDKMSGDD